jgi:hypothetical protein
MHLSLPNDGFFIRRVSHCKSFVKLRIKSPCISFLRQAQNKRYQYPACPAKRDHQSSLIQIIPILSGFSLLLVDPTARRVTGGNSGTKGCEFLGINDLSFPQIVQKHPPGNNRNLTMNPRCFLIADNECLSG